MCASPTPPVTQFGRMCQRLGIGILAAGSPQAKGRVERNHGTHEDRWVKKLRRKGIRTLAEVNRYLEEEYGPEHKARYAVAAAAGEDYHLPSPGAKALRQLFRLETERVLGNDWVVRHENRFYQVERQSQPQAPAKRQVTVCEWEDGTLEVHYRGQKLQWREIEARPLPERLGKKAISRAAPRATTRRKWRPGPEHPWRQGYGERNFDRLALPRPAEAHDRIQSRQEPKLQQKTKP
jgi:hypothetical protein